MPNGLPNYGVSFKIARACDRWPGVLGDLRSVASPRLHWSIKGCEKLQQPVTVVHHFITISNPGIVSFVLRLQTRSNVISIRIFHFLLLILFVCFLFLPPITVIWWCRCCRSHRTRWMAAISGCLMWPIMGLRTVITQMICTRCSKGAVEHRSVGSTCFSTGGVRVRQHPWEVSRHAADFREDHFVIGCNRGCCRHFAFALIRWSGVFCK